MTSLYSNFIDAQDLDFPLAPQEKLRGTAHVGPMPDLATSTSSKVCIVSSGRNVCNFCSGSFILDLKGHGFLFNALKFCTAIKGLNLALLHLTSEMQSRLKTIKKTIQKKSLTQEKNRKF